MTSPPSASGQLLAGRYLMYEPIASGGMATVHFGRLLGPVGFARTVAIKRLHPGLASDPDFVAIFLDEARLLARVRHPNVVSVLDVVSEGGELLLVMEYVHGETLSRLVRTARNRGERMPLPVVGAIISGVLHGLHAAHDATNEAGEPLGIVHRDVSPQNVLVGADGAPHLVDFGIAKAVGRAQTTREGQLKGKLPYMAIEQLRGQEVTRRTDVYAASAVLWELLVGDRLYKGDDAVVYGAIIEGQPRRPSELVPDLPPELDALVMRGLSTDPNQRFASARVMALELERVVRPATASEVGAWIESTVSEVLTERSRRLTEIESKSGAFTSSESARSGAGPGDTQVSSISVSRPHHERTNKPRRYLIGAAAALLSLAGVGLFITSSRSNGSSSPPAAESLASEPVRPPAPPSASAVESSVPSALPPASALPTQPAQRRLPNKPSKKAPSKQACKYLGDDGIWHIRPECL